MTFGTHPRYEQIRNYHNYLQRIIDDMNRLSLTVSTNNRLQTIGLGDSMMPIQVRNLQNLIDHITEYVNYHLRRDGLTQIIPE
jgi:hypothetical protein